MEANKLTFLGKEFEIEKDLRKYIFYIHTFEKIREGFIIRLTEEMKNRKHSTLSEAHYSNYIKETATLLINELVKEGVFSVTTEDLVDNNQKYKDLWAIHAKTLEKLYSVLLNTINDYESRSAQAFQSASNNIIGSGVSIWTSSTSTALLYTAMEASILKRQASKADSEYKKAMNEIKKQNDNFQKQQENDILFNFYYPKMAEGFTLYVSSLLDIFLKALGDNKKFNYSIVKKYNMKRSTELLKNLNLTKEKENVFYEAFSCCPYNPDIYIEILNYGMVDIDTFITAKYLLQDDVLQQYLEKFCAQHMKSFDKIKVIVEILANYKNVEERSIYLNIYAKEIMEIKNFYKDIKNSLKSSDHLISWIKNNISKELNIFLETTENNLYSKIVERLDLFYNQKVEEYEKAGVLTISDILLGKQADDFRKLNKVFVNDLFDAIQQYRENLIKTRELKQQEISNLTLEYDKQKKVFDLKVQQYTDMVIKNEEEYKKLRFFDFRKKRELNEKIKQIKLEKQSFIENNNSIYIFRKKIDDLQKEMVEFIKL